MAKNPPVDAGDADLISGLGRSPGEGNGNPPLPGKSTGQRSLVLYLIVIKKKTINTNTQDIFSSVQLLSRV